MDKEIIEKNLNLIYKTRVMTLAVSDNNIPWSSPVYFVFHNNKFYFFSNKNSRHIQYAREKKTVSASIFHDSDQLDLIYGFQMRGVVEEVSKIDLYLLIVKKYVKKFNFLLKAFGSQVIVNQNFFLEKFTSQLYCIHPDKIFLSDNSNTAKNRTEINLRKTSLPDQDFFSTGKGEY